MAINGLGIQTFFPIPQQEYEECAEIIQLAFNYWQQMMITFAAENIAMGITQANKTQLIADALQEVMTYGAAGSLWQAYNALSNVKITPEMAPFLTEARIEWMRNSMITVIAMLP